MTFKSTAFRDLIDMHLTCVDWIHNGLKNQSSLPKAIIEARIITGRHVDSGLPIERDDLKHKLGWWSGAVIYLTILDQIGSVYRRKNIKPRIESDNSIVRALDYFAPELSVQEIIEIKGLRNAFHHDFSLLNIDRGKSKNKIKINSNFSLNQLDDGPVVILPKNRWDGQFNTLNDSNQTIINIKRLGDLVEQIYRYLLDLNFNKELELQLKNGETELGKRYFLAYP